MEIVSIVNHCRADCLEAKITSGEGACNRLEERGDVFFAKSGFSMNEVCVKKSASECGGTCEELSLKKDFRDKVKLVGILYFGGSKE